MSELWGGSGAKVSHASLHSPSVWRLHVAYIDFCPMLQKCTINQYSNKSSFRLEKCSFQASGHKVWVLSGLHLTLGFICPTTETWASSASVTHILHSKNIHCNLEQTHCSCMIFMSFFCKCSIPSQSQLDDSSDLGFSFCWCFFTQQKNLYEIVKSFSNWVSIFVL